MFFYVKHQMVTIQFSVEEEKNIFCGKEQFSKNQQIKDFADNYERCLFGEHLLRKQDKIFVVESQKTALIGNLYNFEAYANGQILFVATSGKGNFKPERLQILKEYSVTILPDNEAETIDQWQDVAQNLTKDGFQIDISTGYISPKSPKGWGYADAILTEPNTVPTENLTENLTDFEKKYVEIGTLQEMASELLDFADLSKIKYWTEIGEVSETVFQACQKQFDEQTNDLPF